VFPAEPAEGEPALSAHDFEKQMAYVDKVRPLEEYIAPDDYLFLDLLRRMFDYDPQYRLTAREAMKHSFFDDIREIYEHKFASAPPNYR